MAKVIIFSRKFPSSHPRKGEETYFVEKFWNSVGVPEKCDIGPLNILAGLSGVAKHHTIRAGSRWKVGDMFSPRVWADKPYRSKQIIIGPDIEIKKIWNIRIYAYYLKGLVISWQGSEFDIDKVAANDGLSTDDFIDWFEKSIPFNGQIICWNENINY